MWRLHGQRRAVPVRGGRDEFRRLTPLPFPVPAGHVGTFIPVPEPQEGLLKAARGTPSSNRALPPDDSAVLLPVGQRVRHFVFGLGRVLDVDLNRGAHLVQFDDMETPGGSLSGRSWRLGRRMSLQRVSGKTPITNNL